VRETVGAAGSSEIENRSGATRVVVGEDQPIYRAGIIYVLREAGLDVVAAAGNADDLIRKARAHHPDVAVVDIRMPPSFGDDGLRAAREIRAIDPSVAVLVLSQFLDARYAVDLLSDRPEGVGYLLKDRLAETTTFIDAVRHIARGGSMIDSEVIGYVPGRRRDSRPIDELSARERDVLALMAEGLSNEGIADRLSVTISAVERHITRIFKQLGLGGDDQLSHRRVLAVLNYLKK
jgi:DNA-binding NarL/FixJ family response regulator